MQNVKKKLYKGIPNITVWRALRKRVDSKAYKLPIVQGVEVVDSLYAFKCKRFHNTRNTGTFGIRL
jgi:hypothetical protein